jgi:Nucleotidyl transferase AbiEii toxin, Type IV TA system
VSERAPKNLPASIRQKLSDLARVRKDDFGLILVKYGLERILYRLTRSAHHDAFVLKGALLFELWTHNTYRPTRDADFLGRGDNAPERLVRLFRELCELEVEPAGLVFDADSVQAERITEDADYEGVRVTFTARLDRARIPIQIDIGFGDAVTPAPVGEYHWLSHPNFATTKARTGSGRRSQQDPHRHKCYRSQPIVIARTP